MNDAYLRTVDSDWYRQRLSGTLICVLAVFLILLARLYYLQIIRGAEFRRQSQNNCVRLQSIPPARGLIFDRRGVLMVDNRPSFSVSIVLEDAKNPTEVLLKLAEFIGEEPQELLAKLDGARGYPSFKPILLKRDLDRDAVAVVETRKLDLPGILVTTEPMRHYIEGKRASHLIGYLGEISEEELKSDRFPHNKRGDFIGKFGVEKGCEPYFHGKPGRRQIQVNALGQVTRVLETVETVPGKNVYLTLDRELQRKTEEMFAEKVGAAVAMDPSNGHVLAMASSPAFDPNAFAEGMTFEAWNKLAANEFHPMGNKAVQGQYPPGSTYKIVTMMAGLEEGVITEDTKHYCPGYYRYGNRTYRCWKRGGHGSLGLIGAMAQSCDVFFFQVGEKLGVDRLARYAKSCGLGIPTGIELDNEASGLIPTSAWKLRRLGVPWQGGETLSVAIGQGFNLVTPIQMVSLVAAVANGGTRYKPLVVERVRTVDGSLVEVGVTKPTGAS
jgi:penicillin-binding protein 2